MRILTKAVFEGFLPKWITLITFRPKLRLPTPPLGGQNFGDFCEISLSVCGMQIREAWSYGERRLIGEVVGAEPFVAAVAAFAEGWGYGAEEVSVGGAVVVHDALEALAVAG